MRRSSAAVAAAIVLGVLGGIAWFLWDARLSPEQGELRFPMPRKAAPADITSGTPKPLFRCDGRTQCEQMTSCEESMFFLQNCPKVQLDNDSDGIPCEVQWCVGR